MWIPLLCLAALVTSAHAHGRVIDPPSRASAWRFGFDTAPNYDDDGLNCGGFAVQWSVNGGRCGICGDPYQAPSPRPHELGGTFGQGVIVAKYLPGSILTTTVDLTTSHRGFWQFKLCPDPESNSQRCFDKNVLELEDGGTKFYPQEGSKKYEVRYRLPEGMVCEHCVLQWRYTAGNNWGDCRNGTQALGCGNQEQFGACSDISIGSSKSFDNEDSESEEEEKPNTLFYYIKNGYLDNEEDNKKNQNRPQQQLLTDQKHEKPPQKYKPIKKTHKNKPSQKPYSNYPSNSHQNYIATSQKVQDTQKHSPYREKPYIIIQDSTESNKKTQPFLGEWLSNYLNGKEKIESQKKLQHAYQKQKLTPPKPKPQSQKQKPHSQKQKPSSQNWQLDFHEGFLEKPWTPHLQPAYFELERQKVTKTKTHRKPRLKHKGPKKKSKWGKLFYGLWR